MNMILTYLKGLAVVGLGRIIAGIVILFFAVQCYRTCGREQIEEPKKVLTSKFKVTESQMQSLIDSIVYREVTPKLISLEVDSVFLDTASIQAKHDFFKKLRFLASNTPD